MIRKSTPSPLLWPSCDDTLWRKTRRFCGQQDTIFNAKEARMKPINICFMLDSSMVMNGYLINENKYQIIIIYDNFKFKVLPLVSEIY